MENKIHEECSTVKNHTTDRLSDMLSLQEDLSSRVSKSRSEFIAMSDKERAEWVNKYLMAIANECEELRREVPWKWWKQHQNCNWEAARKEWVDILHFVLNLSLVLGFELDGSDVYNMYVDKNKENHDRQDKGY